MKTVPALSRCLAALAIFWSLLAPAEVPEAISPRIEGAADEGADWERAATVGEVVALTTQTEPEADRAVVQVMHDEQALVIRVVCAAPPAPNLPALPHDHASIWRHERIEVFIDPTPDTEDYFHLVLDRRGNRYDARPGTGQTDAPPASWDGDWEGRVAEQAGGWAGTLVIPFAVLGAETPQPGDLYRLKVCRDGGREGPLSWPPNPTRSFHARDADGALYFERADLLVNGSFDEGDVVGGAPPPWQASLTSPEVDNAMQGTVETLDDAGVAGGRALRMTKLASALWWPQVWNGTYALEPGGVYEFSVMVRGTLPEISLRANAVADGQQNKMSRTHRVPEEWQRLHFVFAVPERTNHVSVGLSAPANIAGEIFFDQARLQRLVVLPGSATIPQPLSAAPDPDPVQGLDAFMERQGVKPYELYQDGEDLVSHRLIFADRQFGTPVWMLDNSPTVDHTGTASVWSAWNPNGTALFVEGTRMLGDTAHRGWFFNADFSRLRPSRGGRPAVWDPERPDIFYSPASPSDRVTRNNWRTGEQELVSDWDVLSWPASGKRLYGMTRDRHHLFIDLPNRGVFVPFENDESQPIPRLGLYDGRPTGPEGRSIGSNHFTYILGHERFGDLIALRTGMLVDRQTGEKTYMAAPLCGNTNYLRAFHEGRVRYPQGEEWNSYGLPWFAEGVRLPEGLSMEELYDLWRNLPHATHGHESPSPDWQHIAIDGGHTVIARVRDGETRSFRLSPNGGNYHLQWTKHPRFFVGWVRGWQFVSYLRPHNANIEFQIFTDGTFQPIVDTKHLFNGYYSGGDFSMFSADATKIHYGSSMTGRFRNYVAVMARPRPPEAVAATLEDGAVRLTWQPSAFSNETRGYLVYRSATSGDGYALLTPEPVAGTTYRDAAIQAGTAYHYVVTSLEHAGLESGYSDEAVVGEPGRLVVYAEAEHSIRDLGTEDLPGLAFGVDRLAASDWGFLYRHPEADEGTAELAVAIPRAGSYHIWGRIRNTRSGTVSWQVENGGTSLELAGAGTDWGWFRAGSEPLDLPAGTVTLRLKTSDATAQLDLLCLTTDADFVPEGPRPEKTAPPPPLAGLQAENVQPRTNRLTWQPSTDPAFSHYNVYAATGSTVAPTQNFLVGSPTEPSFIDWGLRAGTVYQYAVTAVDRRGNASRPAIVQMATPSAPEPAMLSLAFAEAEAAGDFERKEGAATYGEVYLVPREPEANTVSWRIEVPREGTYYFWLRYLHRGDGNRGGEARQNIRVRLNDETLPRTLGGGGTELHVPDGFLVPDHPLAARLWTWAWPGVANLEGMHLPAGTHTLTLDRLTPNIRYDALVLTDEPSWVPPDGRLRQR